MPAGFPIGCGDTGSGRPLVLLHCSGADRHVWTRMMDVWAAMDNMPPRRILRPELFGCGTTAAWPAGQGFTLDDAVELVARATGELDESFDLIGHSFGGAVALQVARRMPSRLRSLAVIEPTYFSLLRGAGDVADIHFGEVTSVARTILQGAASDSEADRQRAMGIFIDYWNGAGKWAAIPPEVQKAMTAAVHAVTQDFMALFSEPTGLSDLRHLQVPTLIVNGLLSPAPVQHIAVLLEATLPQVERCTLPDAGHMIPLSHAKQLAGLLAAWYRRRDDASAPAADICRRILAGA
ncbi:alpha/beta fold hydrolase [Ferrovibrio sp.]|uniref:alpha/beta hydrolase n=1 Tax=Ferrovibrio sp. TaxID=1917215 RepID=UPI0025B8B935|nr:alpha/beta fold hydrolase [Ferrovibrio sp.]